MIHLAGCMLPTVDRFDLSNLRAPAVITPQIDFAMLFLFARTALAPVILCTPRHLCLKVKQRKEERLDLFMRYKTSF
jgi:hypothetical protein